MELWHKYALAFDWFGLHIDPASFSYFTVFLLSQKNGHDSSFHAQLVIENHGLFNDDIIKTCIITASNRITAYGFRNI
jgi:hypothetical protein